MDVVEHQLASRHQVDQGGLTLAEAADLVHAAAGGPPTIEQGGLVGGKERGPSSHEAVDQLPLPQGQLVGDG